MSNAERLKVVVVGQVPPPPHGQALMIQALVRASFNKLDIVHVPMQFSRTQQDVGRFRVAKVLHLLAVVARIIFARLRTGAGVLYYPPAGPNRIPMYRDLVILLCTRFLFRRVIFHFHAEGLAELYDGLSPVTRTLFRWAYFRPDVAIFLTTEGAGAGRLFQATRSVVVANGVEDLAGEALARLTGDRVILYVGSVRESKGVSVLIDAVSRLVRDGVTCRVRIAGPFASEAYRETVYGLLDEYELRDIVEITGPLDRDGLCEAYRGAFVFCFPSFYESEAMPRAVIEAMQFGLPVVATQWRGIPDLVAEDTGALVPVRDPAALAEQLRAVLEDPDTAATMGQRGRARYEEYFTMERHLAVLEDVIAGDETGPWTTS